MKQIDGFLIVLLLILAGVAFLNHGNLSLSSGPGGVGFGAGFKGLAAGA